MVVNGIGEESLKSVINSGFILVESSWISNEFLDCSKNFDVIMVFFIRDPKQEVVNIVDNIWEQVIVEFMSYLIIEGAYHEEMFRIFRQTLATRADRRIYDMENVTEISIKGAIFNPKSSMNTIFESGTMVEKVIPFRFLFFQSHFEWLDRGFILKSLVQVIP